MTITEQHETEFVPGVLSPLSSPLYQCEPEHVEPGDAGSLEEEVKETLAMMPSPSSERLLRKTSSLRNLTRESATVSSSEDDGYLCDLLGGSLPDDLGRVVSPVQSRMRRSQSCGVRSEAYRHCGTSVRFSIGYRDENLRERCQRNTQQLLQTAAEQATVQSTSTILARKALRYRRIMERMEGADVSNPAFDLTEHLGVRWQRVIPPPVVRSDEKEEEKEEVEEDEEEEEEEE